MSALWLTILAVAVASAVLKAAGPVLLGGRALPARAREVIALLAPALLAALVVVETFSHQGRLALDERALGVAVTGLALARRLPMLAAVILGVAATAAARALT